MGEIGETLRERRMAMKIDVQEVEEGTKIRAKYLRALENEEFNLLPGPAYIKSFLRTYADYLNLDSKALVAVYKGQHERREEEQPLFAARRDGGAAAARKVNVWVIVAAVVLLALVALFLVGAIGGGGGGA